MRQVLIVAILSLSTIFVALTVMIVFAKAWREDRQRRGRELRRELEPKVLAYAHGNAPSLGSAVGGEVSGARRSVLEQILLDHAQRVRGVEHGRLSRAMDDLGFVDDLVAQLGSGRWWQRAEAAEKLGLSGVTRAREHLIPLMQDEVSEVRLRAAKALGELGGKSSIREIVHALNEPNRWSTIRLADILTGMGRTVVDELTTAFDSLTLTGKLAALDILGRIRPLHVVPWLGRRMSDPEPDVRARACHALGCIGDPHTATLLIRALEDEAWPVRAMAAKALGKIGSPEAIETLCGALHDRQWWVRSNSANALSSMGSRGADALEGMLDCDDTYASHQAVLMLEQMGVVDRRARGLIGSSGNDRRRAEVFVKRLIAMGQTGRLRALAGAAGSGELREVLLDMLPEIGLQQQEART
jgi:HEAT repeat protein